MFISNYLNKYNKYIIMNLKFSHPSSQINVPVPSEAHMKIALDKFEGLIKKTSICKSMIWDDNDKKYLILTFFFLFFSCD